MISHDETKESARQVLLKYADGTLKSPVAQEELKAIFLEYEAQIREQTIRCTDRTAALQSVFLAQQATAAYVTGKMDYAFAWQTIALPELTKARWLCDNCMGPYPST